MNQLPIATIALASAPSVLAQEHGHHHALPAETAPQESGLSLPYAREGSETSWMPDSSPVYARHFMAGE